MLFRKKGTASTILAIALLIALITSVNALVNNINSQTTALSSLAGIGNTFLVVDKNSTSTADSILNPNIASLFGNNSDLKYYLPQKQLQATLTTPTGNYTVSLLGVEGVKAFFNARNTHVNGSIAINESQANVGAILSNLASLNVNDSASVTVNGRSLTVTVTGVTQTETQSDSELIVPLSTAVYLSGDDSISFIEFAVKDSNRQTAVVNSLAAVLPSDAQIVKVQQVSTFAQDVTGQITSFLNVWSIAIYVVVAAASYIVAARLITEAKYELAMFRTLGAKRHHTVALILVNTVATAFVGSVLGLAIGIAGAQAAATAVRWVWGNFQLAPFLETEQALQILLLALVSSLLGCIYPALKAARNQTVEVPL